MKEKGVIIQKIVAALLVFIMVFLQLQISAVFAIDMLATTNNNVEFVAYFQEGEEEKTEIDSKIDAKDLKLKIDVSVKNEGYFNGQISLENAGFKFTGDFTGDSIEKIENNVVYLKQINADETAKLEVGIKYLDDTEINTSSLSSDTTVKLNGTYFNSKQNAEISGESKVKINWNVPDNTKAELVTRLLTNTTYTSKEGNIDVNKNLVQVLVMSKLANNAYPVRSTEITMGVPENAQVTVHKRWTSATNGNKDFSVNNYKVENGKLTITVNNDEINGKINWLKNVQDIYIVTYELPEGTGLANLKVNGKIITYDNDTTFIADEQNLAITEEVDGMITISQNEREKDFYKGKIYSGEEREYTTDTRLYIDYSENVEKLLIEEKQPVFVTQETDNEGNKNDVEKVANIEYKNLTINKESISKILGSIWNVTITDQNNNVKAITNEAVADENGNITVEFDDGAKMLKIDAGKPVNTGILTFATTKIIKAQNYTRDEIKALKQIKDKVEVEYTREDEKTSKNNSEEKVNLKETESKATLNVEQSVLRVDKDNLKLNLTVLLESQDEKNDLYKNPEIKITLPKQIEGLNANCNLLYGNGLEINEANVVEENGSKVIVVTLKGEQKQYPREVVGGTTLLIDADIQLNKELEDSIEEIKLNYTNENATIYADNGKQTQNIEFVATTKDNKQEASEIEFEKLNVKFMAQVGEEQIGEGDEVRAGEIIKYTVKVSNNSNEKLEGVTVNATIPENTTLIETNPDIAGQWASWNWTENPDGPQYFLEKTDREIKKENLILEAGHEGTITYLVKVNEDISETKTGETQLSVKCGEEEKTSKISHKFVKSLLSTKLEPLYRNENDGMTSSNNYLYKLTVKNLTPEEQKNVKIDINKNQLINIVQISYFSGENYGEINEEKEEFTIDSIPANDTASIEIKTLVKLVSDDLNSADMVITVKDSENTVYRTNKLSEDVTGIVLDASLTSNVPTTKNIKVGDEIKYTIKVKNTGKVDTDNLIIYDMFSDYLELKSITLNGENCQYGRDQLIEENVTCDKLEIKAATLKAGEEATIEITAKVDETISTEEALKVINQVLVYNDISLVTESEIDELTIEPNVTNEEDSGNNNDDKDDNNDDDNENMNNKGNNDDNNDGNNDDNNSDNDGNTNRYTISGRVWVDSNENGSRDSAEELLSGIKVYAINVVNNEITNSVTTNEQGEYTLTNILKGEYVVVFEYDTEKYAVTKYQVEGVSADKNSDAINTKRTINGEQKTLTCTDSVNLQANVANIDLGLISSGNFSLELEKVINKMVVTNNEGTKTYNFNDTNLAKVEIKGKYLNNSNVLIQYKIKVKNTGDMAGYAKSIVDYIPSSLEFNSGLNKDWYEKGKYLYNDSLANTKIEPGETKELTLLVTKKMTASNTGLINNKAGIETAYNASGKINVNSKNTGSADAIISIKTGETFRYILLIMVIATLIIIEVYIVKEKMLKREDF